METYYFLSQNQNIFLIIIGILGLFVGSFLNVVIYRLPRMMEAQFRQECRAYLGLKVEPETQKLTLYLPFSHCPKCKNTIRPRHNIPVLSYLFLGGKCHYCKSKISIRYPMVEFITFFLSTYIAWRFGVSLETLAALTFIWIAICLTFIDIDYYLLPDELTLFLVWSGLFFSLFNVFCSSHDAILGGMVGYLIFAFTQWLFEWATRKQGMGQGDLKFLAGIGTYLGWHMLPLVILLASLSGILITLLQMSIRKNFSSIPLPFGPYLALSGLISLVWGESIMNLYLRLV